MLQGNIPEWTLSQNRGLCGGFNTLQFWTRQRQISFNYWEKGIRRPQVLRATLRQPTHGSYRDDVLSTPLYLTICHSRLLDSIRLSTILFDYRRYEKGHWKQQVIPCRLQGSECPPLHAFLLFHPPESVFQYPAVLFSPSVPPSSAGPKWTYLTDIVKMIFLPVFSRYSTPLPNLGNYWKTPEGKWLK